MSTSLEGNVSWSFLLCFPNLIIKMYGSLYMMMSVFSDDTVVVCILCFFQFIWCASGRGVQGWMPQAEVCCLCLVSAMGLYGLTKRTPSHHLLYKTVGKLCLVVSIVISFCMCIMLLLCKYVKISHSTVQIITSYVYLIGWLECIHYSNVKREYWVSYMYILSVLYQLWSIREMTAILDLEVWSYGNVTTQPGC
jgi:hypothetical protein